MVAVMVEEIKETRSKEILASLDKLYQTMEKHNYKLPENKIREQIQEMHPKISQPQLNQLVLTASERQKLRYVTNRAKRMKR